MSEDPRGSQPKPPEQAPTNEPEALRKFGQSPQSKPGPKGIFVCCDGTGNEFATKVSLDGNSNVVKLYTALKLDEQQVAYYHPGVGTLGDPSKKGIWRRWSVVKGLAFGEGFQDTVLDAYRYLMQHYASGDRVYIIGFSRGAYTARALAGLLHGYGLLCRGNEGHIPYAWRMYTERIATQKELNAHTIPTDTTFRDTFSHRDFTIHFVGLWDTVSSIGWVRTPLRLLDMAQNPTIQRGRHAVSIDERRCFYQDNLWGEPVRIAVPGVAPGTPAAEAVPLQDLRQVWFPGVHSDVGGSYPQLQSVLANTTLQWMIEEARTAHAVFDEPRVRMVLGTPGTGEPTAQTAALAPLYEKPKWSTLHQSLHGIWWLLEILPHRYYDKDDQAVKKRIPLGARREIPRGALIHRSVRERLKDPCYRPKNVSRRELRDARLLGLVPATDAYLRFEPRICREYTWRENRFVVFAVTAAELGLGLYVLFLLALLAYPHVHLLRTLMFLGHRWFALGPWVRRHWSLKIEGPWDFLWAMLVAAVMVLAERLVSWARRPG